MLSKTAGSSFKDLGRDHHDLAHLRAIRIWLAVFIAGLVLSGVTAFPLQAETSWLVRVAQDLNLPRVVPDLFEWLRRVHTAVVDTNARYPFLAYGTDWLAFGHLVIAVAFLGPWQDPVRNRWIIDFGLIACVGVLPLALIAGPIRGIPVFWRLVDSSFGVLGAIPLLLVRRHTNALERLSASPPRL